MKQVEIQQFFYKKGYLFTDKPCHWIQTTWGLAVIRFRLHLFYCKNVRLKAMIAIHLLPVAIWLHGGNVTIIGRNIWWKSQNNMTEYDRIWQAIMTRNNVYPHKMLSHKIWLLYILLITLSNIFLIFLFVFRTFFKYVTVMNLLCVKIHKYPMRAQILVSRI